MDNIMNLARENGLKKIMVMRRTWKFGSWCIVNKVHFSANGYGKAWGHIHYSDGSTSTGEIKCAGNYSWRVVKVLDDMLEVSEDNSTIE